jgi:hypothetical protein
LATTLIFKDRKIIAQIIIPEQETLVKRLPRVY